MMLYGDDFSFMNAYQSFHQLEKMIEIGNHFGKDYNMSFIMSTPSQYVDALKKENIKWPLKQGDFMNYYNPDGKPDYHFWSGYYTSRAGFKKQIKDASSLAAA